MQSLMTEEKLKLKRVTGGKFHNRSPVFHFEKDDLNHEFKIKRINSNFLNLRLVWSLRKYLKMIDVYDTHHTTVELLLLWHSTITFKALSRVSNGLGAQNSS